jgi:hypothetical protein
LWQHNSAPSAVARRANARKPRTTRAQQAVLSNRRETADGRLNNDLILIVAVASQYDRAVAAMVLTHELIS